MAAVNNRVHCLAAPCEYAGVSLQTVRNHVNEVHDIKFEQVSLEFPDESEFYKLKLDIESEGDEFYVAGNGKKIKDSLVSYLYCHHSGHHKSQSKAYI